LNPVNILKSIPWLLALAILSLPSITVSAETKSTNSVPQIRSTFGESTDAKDCRDPFFPESTRLADMAATTGKTVEPPTLKVPGISGTPGHLLAIINNHTFAAGDEGDVLTSSGRVHLRCLEISANSVLVEINGQTHRINLATQLILEAK
jgi:hypothetical protein